MVHHLRCYHGAYIRQPQVLLDPNCCICDSAFTLDIDHSSITNLLWKKSLSEHSLKHDKIYWGSFLSSTIYVHTKTRCSVIRRVLALQEIHYFRRFVSPCYLYILITNHRLLHSEFPQKRKQLFIQSV